MFEVKIDNPDKLFFTSDLHINHVAICKYCHRPFESRSEMMHALIDNWNSVVPEDGIVINCGDFMLNHKENLKEYLKYMNKLNGVQYLVRGNHDYISLSTNPLSEKLLAIQDLLMVKVEGIKIIASHIPLMTYPADFHVFGHIHTLSDGTCYGIDGDVNEKLRATQYDVGVDQNGYKPVSYWELVDIFRNRAKNSKR